MHNRAFSEYLRDIKWSRNLSKKYLSILFTKFNEFEKMGGFCGTNHPRRSVPSCQDLLIPSPHWPPSGPHPFRGLLHNLEPRLQHHHGERVGRHCRQPQPVVLVEGLGDQVLQRLFEAQQQSRFRLTVGGGEGSYFVLQEEKWALC